VDLNFSPKEEAFRAKVRAFAQSATPPEIRETVERDLCISISVDDLDRGFSSLSDLAKPPIDSLKIDRSFVRNLRAKSRESRQDHCRASLRAPAGMNRGSTNIRRPEMPGFAWWDFVP
jgi:predicted signal transduction protein with EAL and GGDEF domain